MTIPATLPCVLRGKWGRWGRAVSQPNLVQYQAILDIATYLSLNKLFGVIASENGDSGGLAIERIVSDHGVNSLKINELIS